MKHLKLAIFIMNSKLQIVKRFVLLYSGGEGANFFFNSVRGDYRRRERERSPLRESVKQGMVEQLAGRHVGGVEQGVSV